MASGLRPEDVVGAVVQRKATVVSASLDPDDPQSSFYDEDRVRLFDDE